MFDLSMISHDQNNLPHMIALLEGLVRGGGFGKGKGFIDYGFYFPGFDPWPYGFTDALGEGGFLGNRTVTQCGPAQGQALLHDGADINLGSRAVL